MPDMNKPTELPSLSTSLLLRAQAMEPDAWARLVQVFSPIVYRWARQSGLSADDSTDVVQDVFVAVAQNINRFGRHKEKGSFRSWLATITRNRVRDAFRRKLKMPDGIGGTEALRTLENMGTRHPRNDDPSDQQLEETISLADLECQLPLGVLKLVKQQTEEKTWQAFWATTVLGDSANDVAERMNMNVASVYQAKSRILRRLRTLMKEIP